MKKFLPALALLLLAAPNTVAAQQAVDPSGVWLRDDGNARVRIASCGSDICATNLWIGDTSKGEEVGDKLIMTLKPKSANTLAGTARDPKRSMTYSISVRVSGDRLRTRGCVLGGVVCKNVDWKAAK